jgi:hypothetical protein
MPVYDIRDLIGLFKVSFHSFETPSWMRLRYRRMRKTQFSFKRSKSKYQPHQGKVECLRRLNANSR